MFLLFLKKKENNIIILQKKEEIYNIQKNPPRPVLLQIQISEKHAKLTIDKIDKIDKFLMSSDIKNEEINN